MLELAIAYGHGPMLLRDIAERQHLPTTYLEQLMVPLRKSKLVTATRGIHGGYILTRDPAMISLAEVIQVLEGPLELVDCAAVASCYWHPETCALKFILNDASQLLVEFFSRVTLDELAKKQQMLAVNAEPLLSYAI